MPRLVILLSSVALSLGCLGYPETVEPVRDFEISRYLGEWYEIARLDHSFERGLERVSAAYALNEDGTIRVTNRGFSAEAQAWKEAVGKAKFVRGPDEGYLKVSFFGPFYGSYVIFELDHESHQYAFVSGPNTDYLWLLARTPTVEPIVIRQFTDRARELGFETDRLIFVMH